MAHNNPKENLESLQEHLDSLKQATRLLKLASKQDSFNSENFENMHYLIDMYQSVLENYLDETTNNLNRIHKYVRSHLKDAPITPNE